MQALLLIGGQATRLYPLSKSVAKSLLPVCDRELLHYQITQLARAGVSRFILAAGHLVEQLSAFVAQYSGGLEFIVSTEPEPLGTAGAIAYAKKLVGDEDLIVLNADILASVDFSALIDFHNKLQRAATLVGYKVDDPSRFGLFETDGDRLTGFREKPEGVLDAGPHYINAGVYVLSPRLVDLIPEGRRVSIERETFPQAIERFGPLAHYAFEGLWGDIGTFESYFAANFNLLARRYSLGEETLWGERDDCAIFKDLVFINKSCRLGEGADLFHRVILMRDCKVGGNSRLRNVLALPGCSIGSDCQVEDSIVGPGVVIPNGANHKNQVLIKDEQPLGFFPGSTPLGSLLSGN